ncbi:radical SAM/SPASM domain-containing protein [Candidatus Venteria ishoeyi]|nr:radical SAM protein [Candidatus Venteria ishoeyi]
MSVKAMNQEHAELSLLAINLTRRCNLACAHCYLDADTLRKHNPDELSTQAVCDLLDDVATLNHGTMVVLTGGEPLLRRDLEAIVEHGTKQELAIVLGTNGALLTRQRAKSLQQAGLMGVGISVDSLNPEYHDKFRGQNGTWQQTMNGIENCRRIGLSFQIHFSITDDNADELPAMIEFAQLSGARVMNIFFLVCTGRGESFSNINPTRYEQSLKQIIQAQADFPDLIIRPRCAPHFKRVAWQQNSDSPLNQISGREGDGCIAGIHYARVKADGGVTACPYIENEVGHIRQQKFSTIWQQAQDFQQLRQPKLSGRCGVCEYQQLCGGCRARPVAVGKSLMDEDNFCAYVPQGGSMIQALSDDAYKVTWSEQAHSRLQHVPKFLRKMVKKRAEAYVAEQGETEVTTTHLSILSARRFGGKPGNHDS